MNRAAQSLAWAGIGLVAVGMVIAFVAVIAGRSGAGDTQEGARVVVDQTTAQPPARTSMPDIGGSEGASPTTAGGVPDTEEASDAAGLPDPGTVEQTAPPIDGTPGSTLTTAAEGTLDDRLITTAIAAGFVVFALDQPGWRMTALDAGGSGSSAYLTLAYENGEDYINLSQSPSGARPSLTDAEPVTLRGLSGELVQTTPVLLLRWDEEGTGLLFSTDLSRDRALALAERLRPVR